jgi:mannitol/fructose-specific phosphotransferase system IIA component (Ntr-type)
MLPICAGRGRSFQRALRGVKLRRSCDRAIAVLLTDLLAPARVKVPLRGETKEAVMRELLAIALPGRDQATLDAVMAALRAREDVLSTGIGDGVAIPHAKTASVSELLMAAGVSARPVDYDALDGEPADLFFLLLGPETAASAHVKALGRISRVLRRPGLRDALRHAPDATAFLRVIAESEAG